MTPGWNARARQLSNHRDLARRGEIEIRALRPEDGDGFRAAIGRMNDESLHRRFFGAKRYFTEKEAAYFLAIDFVDHVALVALAEEDGKPTIVGGARYVVVRSRQGASRG